MLETYRSDFVDFSTSWMREHYLFLSGQKAALEVAPIYDRHSDLFSRDSIDKLKQALAETPEHFDTERVRIRRLLLFATEQFLECSAKELTESISDHEARSTIQISGRVMTLHEASVAISIEPDPQTRRAIHRKRAEAIQGASDLRAERIGRLHAAARTLGYESYTACYEDLRQFNYGALAREAQSLLTLTEDAYISRLDKVLRSTLGVKLEEAERSDAMFFLNLSAYKDRFPAGDLFRVYEETFAGLGFDTAQENIFFDSEPRPSKTPRAFCMPISIPDEIRLVIRPVGGQADFQTLLHEAGHAHHYAGTSKSLAPEFKYIGDYALTETYAFLFNHLISNGPWLNKMLGFWDSRDFVRHAMLTRLLNVRRYVAKLTYEHELQSGDDFGQAGARYAELQTAATRFRTEPTEFLSDLDDSFYSANYVRAWQFEVMLRRYLMTRFGSRWWSSRKAGRFLMEIWELGDRYTADQMAAQIGIGPISFEPLVEELRAALQ
jgi:hypothetical protein